MKTGIIIAIVAAVLIVGGIVGYGLLSKQSIPSSQTSTQSAASANTAVQQGLIELEIQNFAFVPSDIKIKVGSKITWYNRDNTVHTVSSDSGGKSELNSGILDSGESYGHVFESPGTFNYHCNFHNGMKGKVVVV
jgi:plastocyanin